MRSLQAMILPYAQSDGGRGLAQAELSAVLAEMDSALTGPVAAAEKYEDSAARFEELLGEQHLRVARSILDACVSRLESGQMARAKALCLRGTSLYESNGEAEGFNAAIGLNNLAAIAYNNGLLLEADEYSERSGVLFERHKQPFAQLQNQLLQARIAAAHGRYEKALAHLALADDLRSQHQLENSELVLELGQQRIFALVGDARLEDAEIVLSEVEPVMSAMLPADRARNKAWTEVARAQLAGARKQMAELEAAINAALSSYIDTPGRNDLEQGWIYADLAAAAVDAGLPFKAAELADAALELLNAEEHGVHWASAWAVRSLSGGAPDSARDALARDVFTKQQVETRLARSFLRMP
jgi:tetratricopeptide (TPR) repeat protein